MEKYTLNKNKSEIFKCHFNIDGASADETMVRLCLEFDDNKNFFFYGKLDDQGVCEITVPTLKELNKKTGKLVIEAVADSTYFKVYEAQVEVKSSVDVKLVKTESTAKAEPTSVKLEQVTVDEEKAKPENPFVPKKTHKNGRLGRFEDFVGKKD